MMLGLRCTFAARVIFPQISGRSRAFLSQVPETLIGALTELEQEYTKAMNDPGFKVRLALTKLAWKVLILGSCPFLRAFRLQAEFAAILKDYVGRESPLYHAERLSEHYRRYCPQQSCCAHLLP